MKRGGRRRRSESQFVALFGGQKVSVVVDIAPMKTDEDNRSKCTNVMQRRMLFTGKQCVFLLMTPVAQLTMAALAGLRCSPATQISTWV